MQVLHPDIADFIADRAEYFQQYITEEQCTLRALQKLLADTWHTIGDAKRWGDDLEISALSSIIQ